MADIRNARVQQHMDATGMDYLAAYRFEQARNAVMASYRRAPRHMDGRFVTCEK